LLQGIDIQPILGIPYFNLLIKRARTDEVLFCDVLDLFYGFVVCFHLPFGLEFQFKKVLMDKKNGLCVILGPLY